MLCLNSNHMVLLLLVKLSHSFDSHIVAFRCATRKYDFFWIRSNQSGHLFSGILNSVFSVPAELVGARVGVPKLASHEREHGVKNSNR